MPGQLDPNDAHRRSDAAPAVEEFCAEFENSYRVYWLVAAAIVTDKTLADDVVQEAAIIALRKLDTYEAGTNLRAWMNQIVRFVALNQLRKKKSRPAASIDASQLEALPEAIHQAGLVRPLSMSNKGQLPQDQQHFDDQVMRALRSLDEVPRACLLLRTVEGLPYDEIASALEIPQGTAMSHVHRSRHALRERLGADEGGQSRTERRGAGT